MSGRKNHHIPQFLQYGFSSSSPSKKTQQVYIYGKDKSPYLTSTANFGAVRDFYIHDGDVSVDDLITDFEGDIQDFINSLREGAEQAVNDRSTICLILAHLEMRSKFIRDQFYFLSDYFLEEIRKRSLQSENMQNRFRKEMLENIDQIIEAEGLTIEDNENKRLLGILLEQNADKLFARAFPAIDETKNRFTEMLTFDLLETVKSGHLRALKTKIREAGRLELYNAFCFRVIDFAQEGLVLPDTIVAFLKADGRATPFAQSEDKLTDVYLPLSPSKILHGFDGNSINRDIKSIARILASCASKNFIAAVDSAEFRSLTPRIGKYAQLLSRTQIRRLIENNL